MIVVEGRTLMKAHQLYLWRQPLKSAEVLISGRRQNGSLPLISVLNQPRHAVVLYVPAADEAPKPPEKFPKPLAG